MTISISTFEPRTFSANDGRKPLRYARVATDTRLTQIASRQYASRAADVLFIIGLFGLSIAFLVGIAGG